MHFFFSELFHFFYLEFFSIIKHPTAEPWHPQAVILFILSVQSMTHEENIERKGEYADNDQCLLFSQCFYHIDKISLIFTMFEIVVSEIFHFETVKICRVCRKWTELSNYHDYKPLYS